MFCTTSYAVHYDIISYYPFPQFPINSQYLKTQGVDSPETGFLMNINFSKKQLQICSNLLKICPSIPFLYMLCYLHLFKVLRRYFSILNINSVAGLTFDKKCCDTLTQSSPLSGYQRRARGYLLLVQYNQWSIINSAF